MVRGGRTEFRVCSRSPSVALLQFFLGGHRRKSSRGVITRDDRSAARESEIKIVTD